MRQNILLLTTGGTIASTSTDDGLRPTADGDSLLGMLGCDIGCSITVKNLLTLDSSNMQPEEWQLMARTIFEERLHYDGIVLTHGTDTMAYTASMLSFMLPGIEIPVVLTGSQLPIFHPLSDAQENLRTAFAMAQTGIPGVFIAFDRKVLLGCRSVKVRTTDFKAFESINIPPIATVSAQGLVINRELLPKHQGECRLMDKCDSRVTLLKLIPGLDPKIFPLLRLMDCRGVVLEAFGSGGLAFVRRNLVSELEDLVAHGIPVVVCSQCLYEKSDMSIYEVGQRALQKGVLQGGDLTSEAAVTKMMWALANSDSTAEIAEIFSRSLVGECSELS